MDVVDKTRDASDKTPSVAGISPLVGDMNKDASGETPDAVVITAGSGRTSPDVDTMTSDYTLDLAFIDDKPRLVAGKPTRTRVAGRFEGRKSPNGQRLRWDTNRWSWPAASMSGIATSHEPE